MEAPIVYSVLPFSRRPSHDNTAGVAGKAGQEFHRSPAHRQDDGWMSQSADHPALSKMLLLSTKTFLWLGLGNVKEKVNIRSLRTCFKVHFEND